MTTSMIWKQHLFSSQLEISHVLNGTTALNIWLYTTQILKIESSLSIFSHILSVSHLFILTLSYMSVECVCVCNWTKEKGLSCQFPSGSARDIVYSWAKTRLFTANIQWCTNGMTKNLKRSLSKTKERFDVKVWWSTFFLNLLQLTEITWFNWELRFFWLLLQAKQNHKMTSFFTQNGPWWKKLFGYHFHCNSL